MPVVGNLKSDVFHLELKYRTAATGSEVRDFLTKKCNEATTTIRAHAFLVGRTGRIEEQDSAIM